MTSQSPLIALDYERLRPVRIWLYVLAFLCLDMILVGGATRLTESGLSITSWKPISGIIPPLSDADWFAEFEAYKLIPQYQEFFSGWMGVEEFKLIFWWEWLHRIMARLLGVVFAIPFVIFLIQRRIPKQMILPLTVLFILGALQGVLGWWMVTSGLTELTYVSHIRLAMHLTAAGILYVALLWVARSVEPEIKVSGHSSRGFRAALWILVVFVFIQIIAGAFVAGLRAGYSHNTWPLMDGKFIPDGLFTMAPTWLNFFSSHITTQFNHRMIAYALFAYVLVMFVVTKFKYGFSNVHVWMVYILIYTLVQIVLGIATLLTVVALPLALAHQVFAFSLVAVVIMYLSDLHRLSRR